MKTNKELEEIEKELTEDFLKFLTIKDDENIRPISLVEVGVLLIRNLITLTTPIKFYVNRINNLSFLWEKDLFVHLKSTYGGEKIFIFSISLSSPTLDPRLVSNYENYNTSYYLERKIMINFWQNI